MFNFSAFISIFILFFIFYLIIKIKKLPHEESDKIKNLKTILDIDKKNIRKKYKNIFLLSIFLTIIIFLIAGIKTGISFFVGMILASIVDFISRKIFIEIKSVDKNIKKRKKIFFDFYLNYGLIIGFLIASLSLFLITGFFLLDFDFKNLIILCLGISLFSLFNLQKKNNKENLNTDLELEKIKDNINNFSALSNDFFQIYFLILLLSIFLGESVFYKNPQFIFLPLFLGNIFILSSIVGSFFINLNKNKIQSFFKGMLVSIIIIGVSGLFLIKNIERKTILDNNFSFFKVYTPFLIGLLIIIFSFYFEILFFKKQNKISNFLKNINLFPLIFVIIGLTISFFIFDIYGVILTLISITFLLPFIIGLTFYYFNNSEEKESIKQENKIISERIIKNYFFILTILSSLIVFFAFTEELINLGIKNNFYLNNIKVMGGLLFSVLFFYFIYFLFSKEKRIYYIIFFLLISPFLIGYLLGIEFLSGFLSGMIVVLFLISFPFIKKFNKNGNLEILTNHAVKILTIVSFLIIEFLI
ncbi:MAG TPA: hypothetical protein PK121_01990 [Candidatus Pacearchaeota archaeon]|nr:hypothetical protein [Candidatus Pacearchaeota archaeon]